MSIAPDPTRSLIATYGWLARDRAAGAFLATSIAARLAFGLLPLGLILFVQDTTGSLAAAGGAAGAWGLASALHPARGRLVDRYGPRALLALLAGFSAGLVVLVAVAETTRAPAPVIATAAVVGLLIPPIGPFARAVWGAAYRDRPDRLQAAYAADSTFDEATLVAGPVLVGAAVAIASPAVAIVAAAIVMLIAGTLTARSPLARAVTVPDVARAGSSVTARREGRARLRLALMTLAGPAVALGALEITAPAFAAARDAPAAAGLLAAALSVGSVIGGLLYGAYGGRGAPSHRLTLWAGLYTLALLPLGLADSLVALGLLLVLPGLALGPLWVILFTIVDAATPTGQGTRIFGWVVAINNAGVAAGIALGGLLVDDAGTAIGFTVALAAAATGLGCALVSLALDARATASSAVDAQACDGLDEC